MRERDREIRRRRKRREKRLKARKKQERAGQQRPEGEVNKKQKKE